MPAEDEKELAAAKEMANREPDRFKQAGEVELDMWYPASWWNRGRVAGERPVTRISGRNADYL